MQEQYTYLVSTLTKIRDKQVSLHAIAALASAFAAGILVFSLTTYIELFAWAPPSIRALFAVCVVLALGVTLVRKRNNLLSLVQPSRRLSIRSMALVAGQHFRQVGDRLSNSLQLYEQSQLATTGSGLAQAQFSMIAEEARSLPFQELIDTSVVKRPLLFLLSSLALFAASLAVPGYSDAAYRNIAFTNTFIPPAPFSLSLQVVPATVVAKGSSVELVVNIDGAAESVGGR